MAEWSKAHAWKVCKRRKRFKGSNPFLSAFLIKFIIKKIEKKKYQKSLIKQVVSI